ncbi:MAG TPA: transporter [Vicinamibacterales bacterium]|nr:transporter [Vicinamibacterales bacterium]
MTLFSRFPGVVFIVAGALAMVTALPPRAEAQQSVSEVLTFLLTNRSIPTDDFVLDARAAAATADAFSGFLLAELGTLPVGSSASGFSYRLNPALGATVRSSDSFGPIFIERSLTAGEGRASFALSFQSVAFDSIDGRKLRDGTLVSVASRLNADPQPFDVETVTLRLRTDAVLLSAGYGVTDRLDLSATIPMIRLALDGQRIDTYRGLEIVQATATATASGLGDAVVRAKYNFVRNGASGFTVGGEMRLPTGSERNLLGTGQTTLKARLIGSLERDRVAVHGDFGYTFGGVSGELDYGGAVTMVATPRVTFIGELAARRLGSIGRLAETTQSHPTLAGVETVRLTGVPETTHRAILVLGAKWNVAGAGILGGHVMRPITSAGLTSRWIAALTFDYSFEY